MEERSLRAKSLSLLSDISLHNLVMLSKGLPGRKDSTTPSGLGYGERTGQHMLARGWSPEQVDNAATYGDAIDVIGAPTMRRYIDQAMRRSVVLDMQTREIIHAGRPGFKYLAPESHLNPFFSPLTSPNNNPAKPVTDDTLPTYSDLPVAGDNPGNILT